MKIVIVIDSWNQGNGCIVTTHRLVKELQDRNHVVSLVTTDGKEVKNFNGEAHIVPGFYLPPVKEAMQNMDFLFGKGDKKILRKAYEGADIVQIQFPYFMARNAVKVANEMKIPVLGACHIQSQNMTGAMSKDSGIMDYFFNTWFNFELFKRVPAIHCPSQFAADWIEERGAKSHYRVISNGIPRPFVPRPDLERPAEFKNHFVLLNIGRLAQEKRQKVMIEAVKRSKYKNDIKLMICGKGELAEELRELGKDLPVTPTVRYISDEEKLTFLNHADLYLHTSQIELESLSCLEAIGCGLPCLIEDADTSATSQFALDEHFLFTGEKVEDLTEKIDFLYENRELLETYKKKTLEDAENYRMEKVIDEIEKLHSDVIRTFNGEKGLLPQK